MLHPFDAGAVSPPFAALCSEYPEEDVYPADQFRTEWGPVFHRGRLDGSARILVIGQDAAGGRQEAPAVRPPQNGSVSNGSGTRVFSTWIRLAQLRPTSSTQLSVDLRSAGDQPRLLAALQSRERRSPDRACRRARRRRR